MMTLGTTLAALLRPEQRRDDARLAILVALLRADATSTGALLTAAGEGSREDRLIALADRLAGRIGDVPGSYVAKGKG
ncbi:MULTISPECIES: hypothetical protein [unclassified Variovorax]|uniref:hypothetical protein n=1 Tax=unclassified Variovorax TaxID=663243 RepID=UPI00076CB3A9|nr:MULTISPECIES: hypothetical protein [unclassified Variovorax]KWT73960.1 hypothetical protein APY03_5811 [Variovorax sp. WDL1]PNG52296.1 hypothetical protein CHC07_04668 [Variovorax sp. B4]PNG54836.1 hypothetical protein CHC06_03634 [Variovorax sp. B2]VTV15846.1 hypothetical protein WDL1CHR_06208 [Variovorax sp. WDL1]